MVDVRGGVSALLNVGLGFNQEATLVENIVLRSAAMGQSIGFAKSVVREVLEFAELTAIADRRLSTLSAGERMRLGFAISTQVQPEILLLDEWIGTGDDRFMRKAKERMKSRVAGSGIVVLASHNHHLLRDICPRAFVIEQGRIIFDGPTPDAMKIYREVGAAPMASAAPAPEYIGNGRLAHGTWLGLGDLDLQKRYESLAPEEYSVAFTSPCGFPLLLDRLIEAAGKRGFRVTSVGGSTRVERVTWLGTEGQMVVAITGITGNHRAR